MCRPSAGAASTSRSASNRARGGASRRRAEFWESYFYRVSVIRKERLGLRPREPRKSVTASVGSRENLYAPSAGGERSSGGARVSSSGGPCRNDLRPARKGVSPPRRARPLGGPLSRRARLAVLLVDCARVGCGKGRLRAHARASRVEYCFSNFELLFFARTRTRGGARPQIGPQGVELDCDCALKPKLPRVARIALVFFGSCDSQAVFFARAYLAFTFIPFGRVGHGIQGSFTYGYLHAPPLPAHERGGSAAGDRPHRSDLERLDDAR